LLDARFVQPTRGKVQNEIRLIVLPQLLAHLPGDVSPSTPCAAHKPGKSLDWLNRMSCDWEGEKDFLTHGINL
jgi:hypothetical protein